MASITDSFTSSVPAAEFNKLRDDVTKMSQDIERLYIEHNVLQQLLPNLVDMAGTLKTLKSRIKDMNIRVSSVELIRNDIIELQKRVDAMGAIIYSTPPTKSPPPLIYN